jgi:hypothetical protein
MLTLTIAPSSEMAFVPSVMKFCEILSQLLIFRTCRFDYALSQYILQTVPAGLLSCSNYFSFLQIIIYRLFNSWVEGTNYLYRVSHEECAKLRESVPYVKVYRYNPKHLYPKLNGYGDNRQKKVGASCGSKYCNPHSWPSRDTAHVLETDSRNEQCAWVYQNVQSAKFYQYFHTAGYTRAM